MSDKHGPDGRFRPGNPGGPGRPALPAELAAIKKLTPSYIRMVIAKLARMTQQEMVTYLQTSSANNMELMVASIIVKATQEGDHSKLNFLLDRSIGKVVEERRVQLEPVVYKTTVRGDGALVQEVVAEALGDEIKNEEEEKVKA